MHHAHSSHSLPPRSSFDGAVPKAGDPNVATLPTLDSPFIRQLCRCLRTGKSTATLHDLSRWRLRCSGTATRLDGLQCSTCCR